jgi:hypothetical protein
MQHDKVMTSSTALQRTGVCVVAALLLVASSLTAQEQPRRSGFWISGGFGGGVAPYEMYDDAQSGSFALYIRLGGTPSESVALGFESLNWGLEDYGRQNNTFTVMVYPGVRDFFVKGGVGFGVVQFPRAEDQAGYGMTLGAGWDLRLPANLYLTPNLDLMLTVVGTGSVEAELGSVRTLSSLLLVTVGITWH